MKSIFKYLYAPLFAAVLIMPACNRTSDEGVRAAPENRAATQDVMKQQRDDYVKTIEAKLAEMDQKFDGLDARGKALKGAAQKDFDNSVDNLRTQRKDVDKKLSDLKAVSIESWTTLRGDVDTAMADLQRSYDQISANNEVAPPTSGKARTH